MENLPLKWIERGALGHPLEKQGVNTPNAVISEKILTEKIRAV